MMILLLVVTNDISGTRIRGALQNRLTWIVILLLNLRMIYIYSVRLHNVPLLYHLSALDACFPPPFNALDAWWHASCLPTVLLMHAYQVLWGRRLIDRKTLPDLTCYDTTTLTWWQDAYEIINLADSSLRYIILMCTDILKESTHRNDEIG